MNPNLMISRRALIVGLAAAPIVLSARSIASAETLPKMTVTKDPSCGCCGAWVDHVRKAGFPVEVIESPGREPPQESVSAFLRRSPPAIRPKSVATSSRATFPPMPSNGYLLRSQRPGASRSRACRSAPPEWRSRAFRTTPTTSSCSEPRVRPPLAAIAESSDPRVQSEPLRPRRQGTVRLYEELPEHLLSSFL